MSQKLNNLTEEDEPIVVPVFHFGPAPEPSSTDPTSISDSMDEDESPADAIAKQLIGLLVGAFRTREGRDPTAEEVEEMMSELTEERINALMGGEDEEQDAEEYCDEEEQEGEEEGEGEEESEMEGAEEEPLVVSADEKAAPAETESETWHDVKSPLKNTAALESNDENAPAAGNKRDVKEAGLVV